MQRSSWIALTFAGVLLFIATMLYTLTFSERAGQMSQKAGEAMVEKGCSAVEQGDVNGLLSMFSANANVLGRKPDDFRDVLTQALHELRGSFRITPRDVAVKREGNNAEITFVVDVGQKNAQMDVVYFPNVQMRAIVQKTRTARWLGLFDSEEWKVTELTSDPLIVPKSTDT